LYVVRVVGTGATKATVTVKTGATPVDTIKVDAANVGTWYNKVKFVVADVDATAKTFTASVVANGIEVAKKYKVSLTAGAANYIEDAFKDVKDIVIDDLLNGAATAVPTAGEYPLVGGTNGAAATNADFITALQRFTNTDSLGINLLSVPGVSASAVVNEMLTICQNRGDAMALIDTPMGLKPQQVVDWHNGKLTGNTDYPTAPINSSFGAIYWSWLQVLNPYTNKKVWCPPSGLVGASYAYNDGVGETWFAPAGLRRGRMLKPLAVEYSPTGAERDLLYAQGNVINSIVNFAADGITIWGQRTAQRDASATDRVNVRRLMLMSRRAVAISTKFFTFEQNDAYTWNEWKNTIEPFFAGIKARRGLYDYLVQMDATTVTSDNIDRGEMPGRIFLQPTKAAEFIPVDFVLKATGASFK
jgi:phage tail sheath protein FI